MYRRRSQYSSTGARRFSTGSRAAKSVKARGRREYFKGRGGYIGRAFGTGIQKGLKWLSGGRWNPERLPAILDAGEDTAIVGATLLAPPQLKPLILGYTAVSHGVLPSSDPFGINAPGTRVPNIVQPPSLTQLAYMPQPVLPVGTPGVPAAIAVDSTAQANADAAQFARWAASQPAVVVAADSGIAMGRPLAMSDLSGVLGDSFTYSQLAEADRQAQLGGSDGTVRLNAIPGPGAYSRRRMNDDELIASVWADSQRAGRMAQTRLNDAVSRVVRGNGAYYTRKMYDPRLLNPMAVDPFKGTDQPKLVPIVVPPSTTVPVSAVLSNSGISPLTVKPISDNPRRK